MSELLKNIKIITDNPRNPEEIDTIYLIGQATEDEIKEGNYIEILGLKISSNPKRHGVIRNVKR